MKDLVWKTLTVDFSIHSQKFVWKPRKVISANTVWLKLEGWSTLDIYPASRYEIVWNKLTLFAKWERKLTEAEKHVLTTWFEKAMIKRFGSMEEYNKQCHIDMMTDWWTTYRAEKIYFENSWYDYLFSSNPIKYVNRNWKDYNDRTISENTIKWKKELEYTISD